MQEDELHFLKEPKGQVQCKASEQTRWCPGALGAEVQLLLCPAACRSSPCIPAPHRSQGEGGGVLSPRPWVKEQKQLLF